MDYRYRGAVHPKAGLLESIWLHGINHQPAHQFSGGLLDRPVVLGMNAATERYDERQINYGNGLTYQQKLDATGRVIEAGNSQIGQTKLSYSTFDRQTELATDPKVTLNHSATRGQQAGTEAEQVLISRLRSQLVRPLDDPLKYTVNPQAPPTETFANRSYDTLGRQTQHGHLHYVYDSLNRLIEVRSDALSGNQRIASYRYNLFGQRVAKTIYAQSTRHVTSHDSSPLTSSSPSFTPTQSPASSELTTHYFYDGSSLVAESDDTGKIQAQYLWLNDKPIALFKQGQLYSIHTDHRNAPVAITDEARNVVWQANVADSLFSRPVTQQNAKETSLGNITFNLRGSNQYYDAETGLHYNTHRYYDPIAARYLTPDPLGLAVGSDLYAFALNQPQTMSDPLGLAPSGAVSGWSTSDKFIEIIQRSAPLMPGKIGVALQELTTPENLLMMGTVMVAFTAMQAAGPIAWIADAALLGSAVWMFGSGFFDLMTALIDLYNNAKNAKCDLDLTNAAEQLAKGLVHSAGGILLGGAGMAGSYASGGPARIADGVRTLVAYATKFSQGTKAAVIEGAQATIRTIASLSSKLGGTIKQTSMPSFGWISGEAARGSAPWKIQGKPWELMVDSLIPNAVTFVKNSFKAFDHYVRLGPSQYRMISSKTLNTEAATYKNNPAAILARLKKYVDDAVKFPGDKDAGVNGIEIKPSQISSKEIQLLVPNTTTAAQNIAIQEAAAYAESQGVKMIVSVGRP